MIICKYDEIWDHSYHWLGEVLIPLVRWQTWACTTLKLREWTNVLLLKTPTLLQVASAEKLTWARLAEVYRKCWGEGFNMSQTKCPLCSFACQTFSQALWTKTAPSNWRVPLLTISHLFQTLSLQVYSVTWTCPGLEEADMVLNSDHNTLIREIYLSATGLFSFNQYVCKSKTKQTPNIYFKSK